MPSSCGGNVIDLRGVIQSPGFSQVNDAYDCSWKIALKEGKYLKLELDTIQLYYKDTPDYWRQSYTENVCSQSLEIGSSMFFLCLESQPADSLYTIHRL